MKAQEDSNLAGWLKRKENVYTSPTIQNELIKRMGIQVLRKIALDPHCSPFLTIMADETTDAPNREQVTLIIAVTNDLEVYEKFLSLYTVSTIDAATLTSVIKDLLLRTNISFEKLKGNVMMAKCH